MPQDAFTLLSLFLCHGLAALAWYYPVHRLTAWRGFTAVFSMAYILNGVAVIGLAYALDGFGLYRHGLFWSLWGILCAASYAVARISPREPTRDTPLPAWSILTLILCVLIGAYVRLHDPLANLSLACTDAYVLLDCLCLMVRESTIITRYPAGLSVLLEHLSIGGDPLNVMRFGPQVVALLAIPAAFGFWRRSFDLPVGVLSAILLSGSYLIYPVLVQHTMYPQIATLGLCLPPLFYAVPLITGKRSSAGIGVMGCVVFAFLAMTSTYYALFLTGLIALWCLIRMVRTRAVLPLLLRSGPLLLVLPLFVLFYYGAALPARLPEEGIDTSEQSMRMLKKPGEEDARISSSEGDRPYRAILDAEWLPPPARTALVFAGPSRFTPIRASAHENLFLLTALVLGIHLLFVRSGKTAGHAGFLGFSILTCLLSIMTGIFELPGYQGRAMYLLVLLMLPALAYGVMNVLLPTVERFSRRSGQAGSFGRIASVGVYVLALLSLAPTVARPPVVGLNVGGRGAVIRRIPEDNLVTRFVRNPPDATGGETLFLVYPAPDAPADRWSCVWELRKWAAKLDFQATTADTLIARGMGTTNRNAFFIMSADDGDRLLDPESPFFLPLRWKLLCETDRMIIGRTIDSETSRPFLGGRSTSRGLR